MVGNMGVYIGLELDVDKVTKEEWERAFYKVGEFVSKTPLVELTTYNVLGEDIYVYAKSKIKDDRYIKIDADSDTYRGAESFVLYKDFDIYKKHIGRMEDGKVSLWDEKTQETSYHKYVLATALVLEWFLPDKVEVTRDITLEQIEESKKIVKDLYGLEIVETSATKNAIESSSPMKFLMSLFGVIETGVDYDVFKDEYDMIKRLELISSYGLTKKGIEVDNMSIEELKLGIFKESKRGSYIWNLDVANKIASSDDVELLRKYYLLLSLDLFTGKVFEECEIKFFPEDEIIDLRKPKKLISKFVTGC